MNDPLIFIKATQFAIKAHHGQVRLGKAKLPYVCHPLEVANILARAGFADDNDLLAAAVLHDVVEDCDVTYVALFMGFGGIVANTVAEVTFAPGEPKAAKLTRARNMSRDACFIKTADMASNINSIVEDPSAFKSERAYAYVRHAIQMYQAFSFKTAALEEVFEAAITNFNLNYQPQEI